ncbi:MAG: tetratricopeptide repeat protein [Planctomycetota bacterium]|nr:tetratricopeptide repeat protein [Planctomycetota bacterium]
MSDSQDSSVPTSVQALLQKAAFFASLEEFDQSEELYQQAIAADSGSVASNEYGSYLFGKGRLEEAIDLFSQLLVTARQSRDDELESTALNNLAACYREKGEFAVASRFQQRALGAGSKASRDTDAAFVSAAELSNLANDAIINEQFELAEQLVEESLSMEIEMSNADGQAADWATLGLLAGFQGKTSVAIERLFFAYRLHLRLGETRLAARDLKNMAEIYACGDQVDSAIRSLKRARTAFQEVGDLDEQHAVDSRLAEFQQMQNVLSLDPRMN